MSMNATTGVSANNDVYSNYQSSATSKAEKEVKAETVDVGATYEKAVEPSAKAPYSINKMSAEERSALVSQLKADQEARQQSLLNIVSQTLNKQAGIFSIANFSDEEDGDSIWKRIANGEFTVDEAARKQAQEDISEDGYWGVKQTSQRMFDFASALAGDDVDAMKKMQDAMMKGYEQATKAWGKELPGISKDTIDAANKLFEDYYKAATES